MLKSTITLKDMTKIIVSALLFSVIFGKSMMLPGVSMGDITFIFVSIIAVASLTLASSAIIFPKYVLFILAIVLWAPLDFLIAYMIGIVDVQNYFWGSFMKLFVYAIGSIVILMFLSRAPMQSLLKPAIKMLMFSTWISLFILALQYINDFGLEFPVWLFWFGQGGVAEFGDVGGVLELSGTKIYKLRGIFMEPSLYSIYTILVLAVFHNYDIDKKLTNIQQYAVYASLFLTFSLTSYFLCAIYYFSFKAARLKFNGISFFKMAVIGLMVLIFFPVISEFIIERTLGVLAGDDRSASLRFLASFDTMLAAITNNLFIGSSLGYLEYLPSSLNLSFNYQTDVNEFVISEGNNQIILFYYFGSLGIIGLSIFTIMLYPIFKNCFQYFLVLFASTFAHGGANELIFWVFYLLGILMAREVYFNSILIKPNSERVSPIGSNEVFLG